MRLFSFVLRVLGSIWRLIRDGKSAGGPPASWPDDLSLVRHRENPTLVLVVHPGSPFASAAVGGLAQIMARCQGRLDARVLVIKPAGMPAGWERSGVWA